MFIYCAKCGNKIESTAQFCSTCGQKNLYASQENQAEKAPENVANNCPICHSNDMVAKVSVLYNEGVQHTTAEVPTLEINKNFFTEKYEASTVNRTVHGTSFSQLAQSLKPPEKPVPPSVGWFSFTNYTCTFYLFAFFALLMAVGIGANLGFILAGGSVNNYPTIAYIIGAVGAVIGLFVFLLLAIPFFRFVRRKSKEEEQKVQTKYQPALREWERQMELWNTSYYCRRDDKIFILE